MMNSSDVAPEPLSFEAAIAQTQHLLDTMEQGTLSEVEIEAAIAQLVATPNGARGFFVTYLTDERSIADQPSPSVLHGLQSAPEGVADLLTKNLAMSSAMAIAHRRNQNEPLAKGSDRVRSRTLTIIQQLNSADLIEKLQQLQASLEQEAGVYAAFLTRWGYDAEQRAAILAAVQMAIAPLHT
jgi:hypothetical protein